MQFRQHRLHLAPVFLALLLILVIQPVSAQSGITPPNVNSRFGAVESFFRPQDAVEAGVGWERIIFEWRYLQPNSPADWDTSHVSAQWLSDAKRDGRMVVGLLKNAPHWATGSDLLGAVPQGLDLPIDDPKNYWAQFVKKVVLYYGQKWNIHDWIIYNEPDIRPEDTQYFEFAGDVKDYYNVVKVAYKAAHAADPKVVIHLAGFTFWQDVVHNRQLYLERFLRIATADPEARKNNLFFDVMTVHAFAGTDWVRRITQQSKSLPESFGFPHPVWINELNIRPTKDGDWPLKGGDPQVTLDEQASFIIQGIAIGLALGVDRIEVYKLYDNDVDSNGYEAWGLIRADNTRRPAYYALQTAIKVFGSTTKARKDSDGDVTLITMTQPGKTAYVIWNQTTEAITARIKAYDNKATDTVNVSTTGQTVSPLLSDVAGGSYEFTLPACNTPCAVEGEPRILIQSGPPQAVWKIKSNQKPVRIN